MWPVAEFRMIESASMADLTILLINENAIVHYHDRYLPLFARMPSISRLEIKPERFACQDKNRKSSISGNIIRCIALYSSIDFISRN